mmetsp:Transcript_12500/g.30767  ORF Transcript_12500/g.30767 Transcript_12500/m.30767 type:complete len:881 (+) Transcript_12500:252-2894(+)|eukprot:CAMPEP_0114496652 /NCGR_PEP_ID=MMETSP0109-20121206/5887_1 /TAXON_ID=29199 /ORGANISM="Chlorarachnion reptans, Strain CCCM449" /LENGTH=880 /DNA_ID=CAMNT_0001673945 /DNA_START=337 /DNA_END=2979 /DNA_ORIENTATION=-
MASKDVCFQYDLKELDAEKLETELKQALKIAANALRECESAETNNAESLTNTLFECKALRKIFFDLARIPVFSKEFAMSFKSDLDALQCLKKLKYFYNLPLGYLSFCLSLLSRKYLTEEEANYIESFRVAVYANAKLATTPVRLVSNGCRDGHAYKAGADKLELMDPHAVYPTSIYRQCYGTTLSNGDSSRIEAVLGTTISTSIKIKAGLLEVSSPELRDVYKPLGRCVAVVDKYVDGIYGKQIDNYFKAHGIPLRKLVYRAMEKDKDIQSVEKMLIDFKKAGVARNEPIFIVGGGVITDLGGFACSLYHRNTPYVMLCTSIVSGIDAGPSPRTCCDGYGYKNIYGAYHPPVLTLTDRSFFKTLHEGWVRHGIAEIIKMAVVKDMSLFELLEKAGPKLITTKFGTENPEDSDFGKMCDVIVGKAMEGYVKSEYGNLWETHQCRPHAYGHTWSPGYEIPSGMLHGHAVATCMGYGTYLALDEGFITEKEFHRILKLISDMELTLYHPIMNNIDQIWAAQKKVTEKRGGNLCAPVPKGAIGLCGYINNVDEKRLRRTMKEYKAICEKYPRKGRGVDMHCTDVGLEPAGTVGMKETESFENYGHAHEHTHHCVHNDKTQEASMPYAEWIQKAQMDRAHAHDERLAAGLASSSLGAKIPPAFDQDTLFYPTVESYATAQTTPASKDVNRIADTTKSEGMFSPCMVGQLEGQFLKMMAQTMCAKRVLDVGTFTGYSALSFAEGLASINEGKKFEVLTIENDLKIAKTAKSLFNKSAVKDNIKLVTGDAVSIMKDLRKTDEKFDIIFLDADKANYIPYYELAMSGMLNKGGVILADNSLCSLVYRIGDERRQKLHDFNEHVRKDPRVEQVVLTVREEHSRLFTLQI